MRHSWQYGGIFMAHMGHAASNEKPRGHAIGREVFALCNYRERVAKTVSRTHGKILDDKWEGQMTARLIFGLVIFGVLFAGVCLASWIVYRREVKEKR
jgi:hypothetical protein